MAEPRPEWLAEVGGADGLFNWFGYWPSFHDAEILSLELNRTGESTLSVKTWEIANEVDIQGYYVLRKHVTVHFLLEGISNLELTGFSVQNVIFGLEIARSDDGFRLELDPCYGLAGSLTTAKLRVKIEPDLQGA
ncbi:MAG TPA: Imm50 family immunity protein [Candidatus Acidoferrum sp.]|nr:Imm50 family immunity protein [Candidatus Acidoferrum sp.]